jgi:hypothetical protein
MSHLSSKASGANPFTSLHCERDYRMQELGQEINSKFVGPMPVMEFLDKFLPSSQNPYHMSKEDYLKKAADADAETKMYSPLVCLLIFLFVRSFAGVLG